MKNGTAQELLRVYKKFYTVLAKARHMPRLYKLDNKTSTEVKEPIARNIATIQYVLSNNHHTNTA